ncbi:coth protein-domain-containing protein [Mycotypha africana]|uniref:coth protein-domain-containing protein n=1 Tax=Mycotypha africana TaxID=64632 RepID=UPI002300D836|nr:coth protein-domain-containing protein [Mycotypha africana]KAI8973705.1 coth protein-domain-containing protein [Mycotypha africana]
MKFTTTGLISLAITLLSSTVYANDVTYSVVAFPAQGEKVSVNVGNQSYPLQSSSTCPGVYTGNAPFGAEYHYALVDASGKATAEPFKRTLAQNSSTTGNEFFGRSKTLWDIPELPQAFPPMYPSLKSGMWSDNEIATVIVKADGPALDKILKKPEEDHKYAHVFNLTYVNHDSCYTFTDAGIRNSGQSSKEYAKQSFNLKLGKFNKGSDDRLFNRKALKMRAEADDPAFIRDKLSLDVLKASGAIHLDGNFARLFVNDKPYGLYLMTDDEFVGFTDNLMNGGKADPNIGATFKGNSMSATQCADLVYKGDDEKKYDFSDIYFLGTEGHDKNVTDENYGAPLISFMKRLSEVKPGTPTEPGTLNDLIDNTNQTMAQLAVNMLIGAWDGFWYGGTNFYLTEHLDTKKWNLITYDFDDTFGNDMTDKSMVTAPYEQYAPKNAKRPFIDAFIKDPYYKPQFEAILKTIVERYFNPATMKKRLDAYTEMLQEDIAWDYNLKKPSPGRDEKFTLQSFKTNMYNASNDRMGILDYINQRSSATAKQLNITLNN